MYFEPVGDHKSKVQTDGEYQYAVVQFLELPHSNIDDYVCVPQSWIRTRRAKDRKATVAFPNEPWLLTEIRIKRGEKPLETWKVYMAVIKHETHSYNVANLYIAEKKAVASSWETQSEARPNHTSLSDTATDISYSFNQIKLSDPQLKTDEKIPQVMSKGKFTDQFPKTNQFPGDANLQAETPLSHMHKKIKTTKASSSQTSTRGIKRNKICTPRDILRLKNEILRSYPELSGDFPSLLYKDLENEGPDEKRQKYTISNQPACDPDSSIFQHRAQDLRAIKSFIIQNQTNLSKQSTPRRTSEVESTYQIPGSSNSAKYQDSSIQTMINDEPTEAEQAVQSEQSSEDEFFTSTNYPQTDDQSCQSAEMEEERTAIDQVSSDETDTDDQLANESLVDEANQPVDSTASNTDSWKCKLAEIFAEMDCNFSHACEVTSELHQSFVRSSTVIKHIKNIYENVINEKIKEASVVTPEDVTTDGKETTVEDEGNQAVKENVERPDEDMNEDTENSCDKKVKKSKGDNDVDDDNDDDGEQNSGDDSRRKAEDDKEKKAPKKTRGHIRTFVLPAEYDPNDTRWTLKYPEGNPKLGLVELLPRSKVYINSIRLAHCKRVAKDSKTLARMLLVEIFTQTALSVCSLTGARANAFDICGTKVRPGLDEHARMVIMNYVEEHARQKNWGVFDSQSVINSIRSKIQEMRAKYGQRE